MNEPRTIWTIGHWTCPIPDFLEPLDEHGVEVIVDVRAHPGSRRNPQFGSDALAEWLPEDGIEYRRIPELGGRRRRQDVDPAVNAAWQNQSFKNYADYTLTEEFRSGLDELTSIARSHRVAIMCGEPMPWRCHRLIIANTLVAQGWTVEHLVTGGAPRTHVLGQWGAKPSVDADGRVTYPDLPAD
ncbi:DUF488 domain-containing protein [Gordonia sp. HY002]|uniref:DUF488 domain-containing protein n=1 Tax=Gordonia zhenghanii TaxID=2911516 RepID=UPI001EF088AB|nr:DUF488 domain-containing protein [Gordonia zhenghanii]MCF8571540.1 DUF488 domain-containing protein [Gordonia zhenghanii]MCF8605761.1 DUF488 domain-containing protein [Gordonia zhenghanii]